MLAACLVCSPAMLVAAPAVFVRDGRLLLAESGTTRSLVARRAGPVVAVDLPPVAEFWGTLADGRLVVSLQTEAGALASAAVDPDPHCSVASPGLRVVLLRADGTLDADVSDNVLRAFPGPVGGTIAVISPERELSLWDGDGLTTVSAPGRVSHVAWSPDGRRLAVVVYPPDWSEGAVSAATTTADFLRLQDANLHLFDVEGMAFAGQLTSDPGTEYGPFFSPDGKQLYYVWLHATEDEGGLMKLDLDIDEGTSASAPAVQISRAGNDAGETPLPRVGTPLWRSSARQIVFEAGRPDGSGEIWTMTADGAASARLAAGRKPQAVGDASVIFLNAESEPETILPEVAP